MPRLTVNSRATFICQFPITSVGAADSEPCISARSTSRCRSSRGWPCWCWAWWPSCCTACPSDTWWCCSACTSSPRSCYGQTPSPTTSCSTSSHACPTTTSWWAQSLYWHQLTLHNKRGYFVSIVIEIKQFGRSRGSQSNVKYTYTHKHSHAHTNPHTFNSTRPPSHQICNLAARLKAAGCSCLTSSGIAFKREAARCAKDRCPTELELITADRVRTTALTTPQRAYRYLCRYLSFWPISVNHNVTIRYFFLEKNAQMFSPIFVQTRSELYPTDLRIIGAAGQLRRPKSELVTSRRKSGVLWSPHPANGGICDT